MKANEKSFITMIGAVALVLATITMVTSGISQVSAFELPAIGCLLNCDQSSDTITTTTVSNSCDLLIGPGGDNTGNNANGGGIALSDSCNAVPP